MKRIIAGGRGHACAKTMRPMPEMTIPAPEAWLELLFPLDRRLLAPTIKMPTCSSSGRTFKQASVVPKCLRGFMFDLIFPTATFGVRFIVKINMGRPYHAGTHTLTCPSKLGGLNMTMMIHDNKSCCLQIDEVTSISFERASSAFSLMREQVWRAPCSTERPHSAAC